MRYLTSVRALLVISLALAGACGDDSSSTPTTSGSSPTPEPAEEAPRPLREVVGDVFEALPAEVNVNREKMLLGRRLFHDTRLSGDETVSCATCHSLATGGAEPRATSTGIRGQVGPINAPTVLNATFNFVQFWDGRAADLLEQAAGPVTNPIEMGGDWAAILPRLRADADYARDFRAIYGEAGVTQANVLDAIVEYERFLVTPSRFDRWLGGDDSALTEDEQRGLRLFVTTGCTTCHRGRNIGGDSYQKMGLVHDYFERRGGRITEADLGRFNVTHDEADRHKFKVPTLRNVALTGPYFHDGSERELAGAVRTMAYVQLGRELSDADTNAIVAFLRALNGEIPADAHVPGTEGAAANAPAEGATAPSAPAEGAAPPAAE